MAATAVQNKNSLQKIRDRYVGEKRNHLREGYGVYKYENQFFKYEGQWRSGKKHGHGKLQMKDGSFYEGEFNDGEITGYGFKYWSSSKNTYSGEFVLGELQGSGVMRYSDESVYEGQWNGNKREGQGKLTDKEGNVYEGEFHNHKFHGDGKYLYVDGSTYEGGYINGEKHGQGVLKMADGTVFDGQWRNDKFNGQGLMIHSSGFTYDGVWVNGQPAQVATKFVLVGVDAAAGITANQGQCFQLVINMVSEDGELVPDDGREIKVTVGFKYQPSPQPKEDSSLFDTIEDVEETLINTPFGYNILPYPMTDQPSPVELVRDDTDLTTITKADTTLSQEVSVDSKSAPGEGENDGDDPERMGAASPVAGEEEVTGLQQPQTQRSDKGTCHFRSLLLLPPPPLYRPFQTIEDGGSSLDSKKSLGKKVSEKKVSETKPKITKGAGTKEAEKMCRPGQYVLMVEDVTDPPFLGKHLPPLFTTVNMKRMKRSASNLTKEKTPKWDTSKHIAQSVASHREETFARESTQLIDKE